MSRISTLTSSVEDLINDGDDYNIDDHDGPGGDSYNDDKDDDDDSDHQTN